MNCGLTAKLRVLVGCHLGIGVAIGAGFLMLFGLFLKPMAQDLGWSRSSLTLAFSTVTLGSVFSTMVAGYVVDRVGARLAALFATIAIPALICALAASTKVSWSLYMATALAMGSLAGFSSPVAYLSVVSRWFDTRLGLAIAVVTSGLGVGQIVNSVVAGHAIEVFGWRGGMYVLAVWCAVIGLAGWSFIPWRGRASADGLKSGPQRDVALWRDPVFWALATAFMLVLLVTASVLTNVAAALSDRGLAAPVVAGCVAVMGMASLIARLVAGALLDWVSARWLGAMVFAAQGAGCLMLANSSDVMTAYAAAFLVSFALGVEADLLPFLLRRRFGHLSFGKAYGLMFGVAQIGPVLGPPMVALAYDKTGSYGIAFVVLALCSCVASVVVATVLAPSPVHAADRLQTQRISRARLQ